MELVLVVKELDCLLPDDKYPLILITPFHTYNHLLRVLCADKMKQGRIEREERTTERN